MFIYLLSTISVFCFMLTMFWHPVAASENLPLPRFVSLKFNETNMRVGPGKRYPIRWVYKRKNMPMEVIDQYEHWRQVQDIDGEKGWIKKTQLSNQRYTMITGEERQLFRHPDVNSPIVVRLASMVIVQLQECRLEWCMVHIKEKRGWIPKTHLWGTYSQEIFD